MLASPILSAMLLAAPADQAKTLYRAGSQAYQLGKYTIAIDAFEATRVLSFPSPKRTGSGSFKTATSPTWKRQLRHTKPTSTVGPRAHSAFTPPSTCRRWYPFLSAPESSLKRWAQNHSRRRD